MNPTTTPYGSPRPLDLERQRLAEQYLSYAFRLAWKFAKTNRGMPADDLISAAQFGLVYAAGHFDPARGIPFGAYANMVISHRLTVDAASWRAKRLPSLSQTEDGESDVVDPIAGPAILSSEAGELCDRIRSGLTPRRWQALWMHHAESLTYKEIGQRMGVSHQAVHQLVENAIDHVRDLMPASSSPTTES
jgi:RNA polymerase sigma factor (sigma-70 family)